jgi:hypothetical protein
MTVAAIVRAAAPTLGAVLLGSGVNLNLSLFSRASVAGVAVSRAGVSVTTIVTAYFNEEIQI